jgi:hypothetical protein
MAVDNTLIITEKFPSRTTGLGQDVQVEFFFIIKGTDSEIDARDTLLANSACPSTYNAGTITNFSGGLVNGGQPVVLQMRQLRIEQPMPLSWFATVTYGLFQRKKFPIAGEKYFNFDTGGGSQHIDYGYSATSYAAAGKTAKDFKAAINVTGANPGQINGVDITVPVYHWSETWYMLASNVTATYRGLLFNATGKTNLYAFKGFNVGECLFLGASGSQRSGQGSYGNVSAADDFEITFKFASSPNVSNLQICGGAITVATKAGWDYLWVRSVPDVNAILQPEAAYVVKVYQSIDFATLGIGT